MIGICACVNLTTMEHNVNFINNRTDDCPSLLLGSVYGAEREDLSMKHHGNSDIATCVILAAFVLLLKRFEERNIEKIDLAQQVREDWGGALKEEGSRQQETLI